MDPKNIEARELIVKAREALRRGDKDAARDLGEKSALLAPDLEDAWLVLTAADANPEDALAYAQKALELNPASTRANKAVEWARGQLKQARNLEPLRGAETVSTPAMTEKNALVAAPVLYPVKRESIKSSPPVVKKSNRRVWIYAGAILGLLICIALGVAGWWAMKNLGFASLLRPVSNVPVQKNNFAQVNIPKPSVTPIDVNAFAPQPTSAAALQEVAVATSIPTKMPTLVPTDLPASAPTEAPTVTPAATETPGSMAMDIVVDTPTSAYVAPVNAPPVVASGSGRGGARWIDVNLSTQSVYAYEGDTVVNSFIVSTGTRYTPTVTGKFKIWIKLKSTTMTGPGYYLPNVPYTMYFYKGYGLHGTYWHNNFGTPMSHGCVNLRTSDAEWLYYWASEGTVVNVHY